MLSELLPASVRVLMVVGGLALLVGVPIGGGVRRDRSADYPYPPPDGVPFGRGCRRMSRRVLLLGLLTATLAACGEPPGLHFVSPDSGTTVSGRVEVVLQTTEPAASGPVTLYGDDRLLGTLLATGGEYRHTLDVRTFGPGKLVLEAVPAAGSPVRTMVSVAGDAGAVGTPGGSSAGSSGGGLADDPLNQRTLLALLPGLKGTAIGDALTYMPPGFPWGSLFAPTAGAALRSHLSPSQEAAPAALPRGVYTFDEEEQFWVVEDTAAGTLEVTFNYLDPVDGLPHDIKINLIWDQSAPTTTVLGLQGPLEVPTGAWLFIQDNETDILNIELEFEWLKPEACSAAIMLPETLTVAGWLLKPREAAFADAPQPRLAPQQEGGEEGGEEEGEEEPDDQFENTGVRLTFGVETTPQGTRVFSQSYVTAVTRQKLEVELGHLLDARGAAVWDGCQVVSFTPEALALHLLSLSGPEGGDKTGAILSGSLLDVVFDGLRVPRSATLDRLEVTTLEDGVGETTVAEDGAVTFSEEGGFTVDGTATLPGGGTQPLGEYLESLFRAYWPQPAGAP